MTKATLSDDEVDAVLERVNQEKFTTDEFVDALKQYRPAAWSRLVEAYGEGGEGAGKAYTASSRAAHALRRLTNQGRLERVEFVDAPQQWGSPVIAAWRVNHTPRGARSPSLHNLTAEAVLNAIQEYDRIGQPAFLEKYGVDKSRSYYLLHQGKRYDSKAIAAAAHGYAVPKLGPLDRQHFSGGAATVQRRLEELGFTLEISRQSHAKLTSDAADAAPFDPDNIEDGRRHIEATIVQRRGQAGFRTKLMKAYDRRCAISDCGVRDVLEAAHIVPYLGPDTNHVRNGLLLRADLHTLFDCGLIGVDPEAMKVLVAPALAQSEYANLGGAPLRLPQTASQHPDKRALERHRAEAGL